MGIQRATVVSDDDPSGAGRLQVEIPASGATLWAARVHPIAAFTAHGVAVGSAVWIAFEGDDPERPIVLGLVEAPARRDAFARDIEALGDAWDQGHAAGSTDAAGGDTPNPFR
ncbi:phage baseplate assembly protein V [Microbacterium sp. SLBN-146]|uniref:phage baseplate assembly protein V n=1 Tax=Microbacterium sp. SLBN-146 TaxID=2768457 RepID=UPI00114FFF14|nr:phage baseplate assembly protein V [Microbacterium sp. SLBN-146]